MTDNTQPEALRLADELEAEFAQWSISNHTCRKAATELLRQHTRIAELEAQLSAIGAGGVSGPPLYAHHSLPGGMAGGWTKASQQLPPCRDDQLYVGINTAGFAGVFNAVIDIAGNVHCTYVTPVEVIDVMGGLDIWQPLTPPTTSAGSGKDE